MTDLVTLARDLRDKGMSLAESHAPRWSERAYAAIVEVARHQRTLHIDDLLRVFTEPAPHFNARGGPWAKAIRNAIIERTGEMRPCATDPKKHFHQYPVYRSRIFQERTNR